MQAQLGVSSLINLIVFCLKWDKAEEILDLFLKLNTPCSTQKLRSYGQMLMASQEIQDHCILQLNTCTMLVKYLIILALVNYHPSWASGNLYLQKVLLICILISCLQGTLGKLFPPNPGLKQTFFCHGSFRILIFINIAGSIGVSLKGGDQRPGHVCSASGVILQQ